MTKLASSALRVCDVATKEPTLSSATLRVWVWLLGVAARTGGFPISVHLTDIQHGTTIGKEEFAGTRCHRLTIAAALTWLEERKFIKISRNASSGPGHRAYTIEGL